MINEVFTETQIVTKGHGCLTDLALTSSVAGAKAILYDGVDTSGKIVAQLYDGDNLFAQFTPKTWPKYNSGLYLVLSGTNVSVNIGYRPNT